MMKEPIELSLEEKIEEKRQKCRLLISLGADRADAVMLTHWGENPRYEADIEGISSYIEPTIKRVREILFSDNPSTNQLYQAYQKFKDVMSHPEKYAHAAYAQCGKRQDGY